MATVSTIRQSLFSLASVSEAVRSAARCRPGGSAGAGGLPQGGPGVKEDPWCSILYLFAQLNPHPPGFQLSIHRSLQPAEVEGFWEGWRDGLGYDPAFLLWSVYMLRPACAHIFAF
ncbi:hypothetical protein DPEC_G00263890 [Dallia pectoralis]|uniref:Uncharacterized protein n=1 Tax=Dallia pectoralis TaxID=75939 RepID=A0ACC2FSN4_DALPE|nr:hypothetical protein DPEC_G00263890 [Dallia pectoralis]